MNIADDFISIRESSMTDKLTDGQCIRALADQCARLAERVAALEAERTTPPTPEKWADPLWRRSVPEHESLGLQHEEIQPAPAPGLTRDDIEREKWRHHPDDNFSRTRDINMHNASLDRIARKAGLQ